MTHDHHHHDHSSKNLKTAFFLNVAFTVFELIGGLYVNSIAIISDAIHDLGDSLSLGTAWYLDVKSKKAATQSFSFGYRRFSLLGALINCIVLIVGSVFVIHAAIGRIIEPEQSNAKGMLLFAIVGVMVNGYAAWKTSTGKTLNERVITWHLLEDVLGWVAVLIASVVLLFTDNLYTKTAPDKNCRRLLKKGFVKS
jgi:cobalt-zinc-cadmium efflux system protein